MSIPDMVHQFATSPLRSLRFPLASLLVMLGGISLLSVQTWHVEVPLDGGTPTITVRSAPSGATGMWMLTDLRDSTTLSQGEWITPSEGPEAGIAHIQLPEVARDRFA